MRTTFLLCLNLILALALAACGPVENTTRSGKLLTMAAEEAGFISSLSQRLTRQLNIADLQIAYGQPAEAIKTLALAAATLKVEEADHKTLDDFGKIAGWTSIAELSHAARSDKAATDAYLNAIEALHSVQPEPNRAQYVLSLSQVAYELKGKQESAQLLVSGGDWASKIADTNTRRFALTSFSSALANFDDLDAVRTVLRREPDPAWRADTLAALAQPAYAKYAQGPILAAGLATSGAAGGVTQASRHSDSFNKNVHYQSSFRQTQLQQGILPNGEAP